MDPITFVTEKCGYSKRVRCEYELLQQTIMKLGKQNILNELEMLKLKGISIMYENQEIIAYNVVAAFKNRKVINVMVVSPTQSGKTGSMCATIKLYLEDGNNLIPIENIYIITGLSSREWKKQTKERMPESIQKRVFHRCELPNTFVDEIKKKQNVLIIMDEIQVAAKEGQTIYNSFHKANLLDIEHLYKNDVKILEYTATPDGTIYDLMEWKEASYKILGHPGDGYTSSFDLLQDGRVKQYKELCGICIQTELLSLDKKDLFKNPTNHLDLIFMSDFIENIIDDSMRNDLIDEALTQFWTLYGFQKYDMITMDILKEIYYKKKEIFENIQEIKRDLEHYSNPLYHIIRTKTGQQQDLTIEHFKKIFNSHTYEFITYDGESEIADINKTLIIMPEKHTFIFIKEMLRCAKTLEKEFIGILYDRFTTNPDDSTVIQGLLGRNTGYDTNCISICYTNIPSVLKYKRLWGSSFEDKTIEWNSKTTKFKNGVISGKNTFNDPKNYHGILVARDNKIKEPVIKKFNTQQDAKEYYNKELNKIMGGRGPNIKKPNSNGFYEANIRGKKKIYSCSELYKERKCNIENGAGYGFRPCYKDITDKSTLEWWFIYYEKI